MRKKVFLFFIILLNAIFINLTQANAAKKFVPKKVVKKKTSSDFLPVNVRYRNDKKGILLSFSNFQGLHSVSYSFTYETNGTLQGIGGTITAANNPTTPRELLFGTCSSGVCRYHSNLKNAKLVLTAKTTGGKTIIKSYRIKTYQ